jgi:hypothetical protein
VEPHGLGNPRPVFQSGGLQLKTPPKRLYGETYETIVTEGILNYQAHLTEKQMLLCETSRPEARFEAAYSVKTKQWNGMKTLVLSVKELGERSLT